jgi:tetratricopeptide (TPR) repeat protein
MWSKIKGVLLAVAVAAFIVMPARASDWDRGVKLYQGGDYRAALVEFQDIIRTRPDAAGAWYYIGLCEFKLKRYGRVHLPLLRAIDLLGVQSPSSSDIAGAWYTIGISHYLSSEYEKTIEPLKQYIALTSKARREVDASARTALGRAFYALNRYDEALALLSTGTSAGKSKDEGANAFYVGAIHFKREDDDRAIVALREAFRTAPEDAATIELLAESLMRKARKANSNAHWVEAAEVAERLRQRRDDLKTAGLLGRAYLGARQFDKAVAPLERLAKASPDNGQAWLYYGISLSRSGQMRKAMEALEITIQLTPDSVPALSELAYVYESDKQYQQALRIYEKAYAITNDPAIKESIERVRVLASQQPQ